MRVADLNHKRQEARGWGYGRALTRAGEGVHDVQALGQRLAVVAPPAGRDDAHAEGDDAAAHAVIAASGLGDVAGGAAAAKHDVAAATAAHGGAAAVAQRRRPLALLGSLSDDHSHFE